ncbi:MAG: hypothetical protein COB46_05900 [Rhodospirillaceae bacterium]|nr:MAG: hypothetical protein COB46_05900 [Rhodospirillaceae bacterium]
MVWVITVVDTVSKENYVLEIDKPNILVGRRSDNDVVVSNQSVSRAHVTMSRTPTGFVAQDTGSKNGTAFDDNDNWLPLHGSKEFNFPASIRVGSDTFLTINWNDVIDEAEAVMANYDDENDSDLSIVDCIDDEEHVAAFLVLDLCRSTDMSNRDETIAYHTKKRLEQMYQKSLNDVAHIFYKSTGDGFLTTFHDARDALKVSSDILHRTRTRNKQSNNPDIDIRISLHFGIFFEIGSDETGRDIHGNDVNITFRIEGLQQESFDDPQTDIPKINRTLCSRAFLDEVEDELQSKGMQVEFCGKAMLKGIQNPMEVFLVES